MKNTQSKRTLRLVCGAAVGFSLLIAPWLSAQDYTHPRNMDLPASAFQRPDPDDHRVTLENGVTAYIVEDSHVPLVTLTAFVRAGWAAAEIPTAAKILEQILRRRGPSSVSKESFANQLAAMAAQFEVSMNPEVTEITLSVPAEDALPALGLLAGVLREPDLTEEAIRAHRSVLEANAAPSATAQGESGPVLYEGSLASAVEKFRHMLFADHPYRNDFTATDFEKVSPDQVREFHSAYFVPGNTVLAIAGAFNLEDAKAALNRTFGDWAKASAPEPQQADGISTSAPRRVHTYQADKLQAWFVLGHELPPVPLEDVAPLQVMNYILGGGHFDTRLFRETRDKRGLTNDASGFLEPNWFGPGTYTFRTYGRPEVIHLLVELTLREIERIRSDAVSEEELFVAKNALADGVFQMWFENGHAAARTLAKEWLRFRNHHESKTYVRRVQAVTAEDVRKAARKYLHPDRMQLVLVGPIKKVQAATYPEGSMRLDDFGEFVAGK